MLAESEFMDENSSAEFNSEEVWNLIASGVRDYEDLFIWCRSRNSNKWKKIDSFFENGLPDFELVDMAKSSFRVSELKQPIYCIVSRLDKSPDNDVFDFLNRFQFSELTVRDKKISEEMYKERVRTWPPDKPPPSREDDEKWGRKHGIGQKE